MGTKGRAIVSRIASHDRTAVFVNDPSAKAVISRSEPFRVYRQLADGDVRRFSNLLVLSCASRLSSAAKVIRAANQAHCLRVLLVRADVEHDLLPQILARANIRTLRNMLVHSDYEMPRRVLGAWRAGAQDQLIAAATVLDKTIIVLSCAMERFELPARQLPGLERASADQLASLEVDEDGSYIYWPQLDVHHNLDSIRYLTDPDWRRDKDIEAATSMESSARAVAEIRKHHGLRQADVPGLSERQVRRIEGGARPTAKALKALAGAHGMSFSDYMEAIARLARDKASPSA